MDDEMDLDMFCTYSNLSFVPDKLKQILRNVAPSYYMDYTKQSNSSYYVNHCECGAKLGDFYMHNEPDGAFFPLPEEQAQTILMYQLDIEDESIEIKASYGTNDTDFIPKYAQKEKLQQ